ncbi:hypothetical protein [Salinicoccus albus]|uniref:hypothetical protein n=1 Tax=Salinicoccus albus TaxID=418756 RepID=UPI0003614666|nr:hypothetical protein [Salinicoccus albus]
MRTADKVTFVVIGKEKYNPDTGNYETSDDQYIDKYANVTDTGLQRMNVLYAGIRQRSKTVRLNEVMDGPFDHIIINGDKYQSDLRRIYRHKTVFEVSGV